MLFMPEARPICSGATAPNTAVGVVGIVIETPIPATASATTRLR
jgi:hypothetical protein